MPAVLAPRNPASASMKAAPAVAAQRIRQRARKNLPDYDPESDLSDFDEGLGGIKPKNRSTWEDDEETAVDDDSMCSLYLSLDVFSCSVSVGADQVTFRRR